MTHAQKWMALEFITLSEVKVGLNISWFLTNAGSKF